MGAKNGHPAHDRFKARDGPRTILGIFIAIIIHAFVFILWPEMTAPVEKFVPTKYSRIIKLPPVEVVRLTPEVGIPKPPKPIERPAIPVIVNDIHINPNITIPEITFEKNPIPELPPPPVMIEKDTAIAAAPRFTPYSVRPEVKNRDEISRLVKRSYEETFLPELGIEGTVVLWFYIDEKGNPLKWLVSESSGYHQLDEVALRLASRFKFRPALNYDEFVPVWIQIPITFKIENR